VLVDPIVTPDGIITLLGRFAAQRPFAVNSAIEDILTFVAFERVTGNRESPERVAAMLEVPP
jgi:hypothetical protein